MKISFIGLGIMGSRMATKLLDNNIKLTVYNRTLKKSEELRAKGASVANTLDEAVKDADIVFSMLSTPEAVQETFLDKNASLLKMKRSALWVDCSTVNPSFSRLCAKKAKDAGIHFLDAPVAGSSPQAENSELVFLVGGEKKLLEKISPYLDMMGKKTLHIGVAGMGTSFKMLVNVMLAQSMAIFSEAIHFGESMGISKDFLLDVVPNLVVSAPFTKAKSDMIKRDSYDVQFPLEWMHKDLHLASLTAYENNQPLLLANLTKELYASASQSGLGRQDFSAIYKALEKK